MNNVPQIENFLSTLISFPSLPSEEYEILNYVESFLVSSGFSVSQIPVAKNRYNIFVSSGTPVICYSTHVDVVPGRKEQFCARIEDGRLYGRGANDAKGQVASQIYAALKLRELGKTNFGLLFVVGEEVDGIGAKTAGSFFNRHTFSYFVNGEPTELALISAHKGAITFDITVRGRAAHSGYPEYGEDANSVLLDICSELRKLDLGISSTVGKATLNIGKIEAGTASNVISDCAIARCVIRTVTANQPLLESIENIVRGRAELRIHGNAEVVNLKTVDGFSLGIASYCTDIPYFKEISKEYLLYGPGNILHAHTIDEFVQIDDLYEAVEGHVRLYNSLVG